VLGVGEVKKFDDAGRVHEGVAAEMADGEFVGIAQVDERDGDFAVFDA